MVICKICNPHSPLSNGYCAEHSTSGFAYLNNKTKAKAGIDFVFSPTTFSPITWSPPSSEYQFKTMTKTNPMNQDKKSSCCGAEITPKFNPKVPIREPAQKWLECDKCHNPCSPAEPEENFLDSRTEEEKRNEPSSITETSEPEEKERSKYWNTMVDILEGQFPKHQCKERGRALVMLAYIEMMLKGFEFDENGKPKRK